MGTAAGAPALGSLRPGPATPTAPRLRLPGPGRRGQGGCAAGGVLRAAAFRPAGQRPRRVGGTRLRAPGATSRDAAAACYPRVSRVGGTRHAPVLPGSRPPRRLGSAGAEAGRSLGARGAGPRGGGREEPAARLGHAGPADPARGAAGTRLGPGGEETSPRFPRDEGHARVQAASGQRGPGWGPPCSAQRSAGNLETVPAPRRLGVRFRVFFLKMYL